MSLKQKLPPFLDHCFAFILLILALIYIILGIIFLINSKYDDINICENIWIYVLVNLIFFTMRYIYFVIKLVIVTIKELKSDFVDRKIISNYCKFKCRVIYFVELILFIIWFVLTIWGCITFGKLRNNTSCTDIIYDHMVLYVYYIISIVMNIIIILVNLFSFLCQEMPQQ
jgi:hypothetical protein